MGANIDLLDVIARFEHELRLGAAPDRHHLVLAILARWQVDPDLTAASRHRAAEVLAHFARLG